MLGERGLWIKSPAFYHVIDLCNGCLNRIPAVAVPDPEGESYCREWQNNPGQANVPPTFPNLAAAAEVIEQGFPMMRVAVKAAVKALSPLVTEGRWWGCSGRWTRPDRVAGDNRKLGPVFDHNRPRKRRHGAFQDSGLVDPPRTRKPTGGANRAPGRPFASH